MSIHKHFVFKSILLFVIVFQFSILFMHLYCLHIFCNQLLLVLMDPLLVTLHETLVRLRCPLVLLCVKLCHILMPLCIRMGLLVELGLSRLKRLSVLKFLAVEIEILAHQTVQKGFGSLRVKFVRGRRNRFTSLKVPKLCIHLSFV